MTAPTLPEHNQSPLEAGLHAQRQFKKHKVLPHPRNERTVDETRSVPTAYDLLIDTSAPLGLLDSQPSSPRTLKHQPRRIGTGPDLPPTPPSYSRASSGSHPAQSSSPSPPDVIIQTPQASSKRPPATPPDQRSPPTPDVTPPQPASRPRALRPATLDRGNSRSATATTDSRTESFKTAREEPLSSDDEAAMSTVKTALASSTPSQTTVLRAPVAGGSRVVQPRALDLALERLTANNDESYTPRTRGELAKFDGAWGSPDQVEQEWDDNLERIVSIGRRGPSIVTPKTPQTNGGKRTVVEDHMITSTNATKAVRSMSLQDAPTVKPSPKTTPHKQSTGLGSTRSETSGFPDSRRLSGLSSQSTPSTVIEAILVDNQTTPQRQRTLRHVRKRRALRETSPPGRRVVTDDFELQQPKWPSAPALRNEYGHRHDSYASTASSNTMASGRARREVWKNGGIPVVVIPDRRSSHKSKSREPSLRSTSSRHSRTRSVGSSPLDRSPLPSDEVSFERQSRWDRSTSVSDRSEQRTIDFPPTIPARSSSLSAPTSRTTSRTGSLTAESLKALNEVHRQTAKVSPPKTVPAAPVAATSATKAQLNPPLPVPPVPTSPVVTVHSPKSPRSEGGGFTVDTLGVDHHDDAASARKYSSRTTPFSIVSVETNWTALEVSEAQAVHMYPHQNSSVLMVDHSARPSDTSDSTEKDATIAESNELPIITTTNPAGGLVTPEQRQSLEEVDSPLRNPRAPPEPPVHPPAINFIPATPSGLTPAEEKTKQLGDFYESVAEKPSRRPSIVRRAFSRRRHSISYPPTASKQPGFLTRTFSLSRSPRNFSDPIGPKSINPDMDPYYGERDDEPVEQDKLHPHWRPQWDPEDNCDCDECRYEKERDTEVYRYPPIDNRPRPPKRRLSTKLKQTFAIMPARGSQYQTDLVIGPERRTIRRTPSGNLRVMRRRASAESLRHRVNSRDYQRPVSEGNPRKGFWRGHSLRKRSSHEKLRRSSSLSSRLEGLPNLSRMWSERRREKRTQELRQMISGPREVRDGVGDVIRTNTTKDPPKNYPDRI
ncbi:hypothetical protein VFPPC_07368 [Pochonia chlamydosporia 170]|uniref:Uncharacterized protein n=1 Tax=Pochonia chlamydosporia 170 TaxID=1380566 RepID=A0A179F8Z3_METCM|nr:hypothetical protein VFPPC_07368 [Pochonia chlamydosporia 170]OAQ61916.1 hypothetical protein VFPPC_07368 [Pochonia chlamydosporia 170]